MILIFIIFSVLFLSITAFPVFYMAERSRWWDRFIYRALLRFFYIIVFLFFMIFIPNYLAFSARAKQSEARFHLKELYLKQLSFKAENGRYALNFGELNWSPDYNLMYRYIMGNDRVEKTYETAEIMNVDKNIKSLSEMNNEKFVIVAVGDIDGDNTPDIWAISSEFQLINIVDDAWNHYVPHPGFTPPEALPEKSMINDHQLHLTIAVVLGFFSFFASFLLNIEKSLAKIFHFLFSKKQKES